MKTSTGLKSRTILSIVLFSAILGISYSLAKPMDDIHSTGGTSTGGTVVKGDGPGINEVWIEGMKFTPSAITVTAGTTITWTNKDAVSHTVTSSSGLLDSGTITSNGTYSRTFTTAGTINYYCSIHPSMTASVIVN